MTWGRSSTQSRGTKRLRRLLCVLLALYLAAVAYVTLKPNHHGDGWVEGYGYMPNLVPLAKISEMVASGLRYGMPVEYVVIPVLGNVAMTMPFGFLLSALLPGMRRWGRVTLASAAYGCLIELSQLVVGLVAFGLLYRTVDIDDVILNTIGGSIGYGLFVLARRGLRHEETRRRRGAH